MFKLRQWEVMGRLCLGFAYLGDSPRLDSAPAAALQGIGALFRLQVPQGCRLVAPGTQQLIAAAQAGCPTHRRPWQGTGTLLALGVPDQTAIITYSHAQLMLPSAPATKLSEAIRDAYFPAVSVTAGSVA